MPKPSLHTLIWSHRQQLLSLGGTKRRGAEPACAWLPLDEPDNDPIRFWLSVIAAVRTCLPTFGEAAREMLHSPQAPPLSTILTTLLDEMKQVGRELILLLDDYHVITDQAIHDSLLALLDHPPANVHLTRSLIRACAGYWGIAWAHNSPRVKNQSPVQS
jgi:ATP/maltotriose-dependent transcriptional regulator MalT